MKRLALIATVGCNSILGLSETTENPPPALLVPPDGGAECAPPPDYSNLTFAPHALGTFTGPIEHPSFLTADRVVFASQGRLFESGPDGDPTPITSLDLTDSSLLLQPSAAAGGNVFWFVRRGGTSAGIYYAIRDGTGWIAHPADLGIGSVNFELGPVGFYAGTARMVYVDTGRLLELASNDGLAWTLLGVVPPEPPSGEAPALSNDGCIVMFTPYGDDSRVLELTRTPDGGFAVSTVIAMDPVVSRLASPTVDPTLHRVWFLDGGQLMQAIAP